MIRILPNSTFMTFMTEDMMMIKNAKLITEKNNSRKIKIRACKN